MDSLLIVIGVRVIKATIILAIVLGSYALVGSAGTLVRYKMIGNTVDEYTEGQIPFNTPCNKAIPKLTEP